MEKRTINVNEKKTRLDLNPSKIWEMAMEAEIRTLGNLAMAAAVILSAFSKRMGSKDVKVCNNPEGVTLVFDVDERE